MNLIKSNRGKCNSLPCGRGEKKAAFTLAEGPRRTGYCSFCHPELVSGSKKQMLKQVQHDIITCKELIYFKSTAFTLAETLITIGIVGVVAAITIPNLISNIQKRVLVGQLKKSYATLSEGFKRMLADDNTDSLSNTETFLYMNNRDTLYNNLRKYFKIASIDKTSSGCKMELLDGTLIYNMQIYREPPAARKHSDKYTYAGEFFIDVNGSSKPNIMGRDRFVFYLTDDAKIYPFGSKITSLILYGDERTGYWRTSPHYYLMCGVGRPGKTGSSGNQGCAARIFEKGKMDY
ncbi:type II secretion system protein [bacterium]|nr:type II secretion system protein [bacterium]